MNLKFSPDYYSYDLNTICINMAILISVLILDGNTLI